MLVGRLAVNKEDLGPEVLAFYIFEAGALRGGTARPAVWVTRRLGLARTRITTSDREQKKQVTSTGFSPRTEPGRGERLAI